MIKLKKSPKPTVLSQQAEGWTATYLQHIKHKTDPPEALIQNYRNSAVKQALLNEVHDKCAYCESKVGHVYPGDVEHMLPKSIYPELIFAWENLTFACSECNRRKGDYTDKNMPLIQPYNDNPPDHLEFHGPLVLPRPGDQKGHLAVLLLDLNRANLLERRKDRLISLHTLVELWMQKPDSPLKELLKRQLLRECEDHQEFALLAKTFIQKSLSAGRAASRPAEPPPTD